MIESMRIEGRSMRYLYGEKEGRRGFGKMKNEKKEEEGPMHYLIQSICHLWKQRVSYGGVRKEGRGSEGGGGEGGGGRSIVIPQKDSW